MSDAADADVAAARRRVDDAAAAYAADEAIVAEKCRPNIPEGAQCYICFAGTGDE